MIGEDLYHHLKSVLGIKRLPDNTTGISQQLFTRRFIEWIAAAQCRSLQTQYPSRLMGNSLFSTSSFSATSTSTSTSTKTAILKSVGNTDTSSTRYQRNNVIRNSSMLSSNDTMGNRAQSTTVSTDQTYAEMYTQFEHSFPPLPSPSKPVSTLTIEQISKLLMRIVLSARHQLEALERQHQEGLNLHLNLNSASNSNSNQNLNMNSSLSLIDPSVHSSTSQFLSSTATAISYPKMIQPQTIPSILNSTHDYHTNSSTTSNTNSNNSSNNSSNINSNSNTSTSSSVGLDSSIGPGSTQSDGKGISQEQSDGEEKDEYAFSDGFFSTLFSSSNIMSGKESVTEYFKENNDTGRNKNGENGMLNKVGNNTKFDKINHDSVKNSNNLKEAETQEVSKVSLKVCQIYLQNLPVGVIRILINGFRSISGFDIIDYENNDEKYCESAYSIKVEECSTKNSNDERRFYDRAMKNILLEIEELRNIPSTWHSVCSIREKTPSLLHDFLGLDSHSTNMNMNTNTNTVLKMSTTTGI